MKRISEIIVVIAIVASSFGCSKRIETERISIIPLPVQINELKGVFRITKKTAITYQDKSLEGIVKQAAILWEPYLGFSISSKFGESKGESNTIELVINNQVNPVIGNEGYVLDISRNGICISANTSVGILYGIQTVYQLLSTNPNGKIPCLNISDYPRFSYRGMHLDVSRHFQPIDFIYKVLDRMAMHKLNTFHWHLVDDQGWRLEIKKYPKLTEVGGWRVDLENKHWNDRPLEAAKSGPTTYGGFYTQEQVRAVVAYAAERNITVMPEIEMPAHVMSALAAYPEYSCTGENLGVPPGGVWPITHIYCAGNDATFKFIEDILSEVMELFPSKYIHIGGDEADKTNWKTCKKCQKRIKAEGLKDENELQSYFIRRIEKFLNANNRIIVGWDEILEGGLAPNATVMSWRGEVGGIEAAKQGNTVIMTPGSHCYFDHYQGDPSVEPLAIGGLTTLKKVYEYEPIPSELNHEQGKLVLGAQANHWSEYLPNPQQVEYMAFPRLAALSEVLWSAKEARNWGNFSKRMESQYKRYEKLGINFSLSAFQVKTLPKMDASSKKILVDLSTEVFEPQIRYTIDGTEPNIKSAIFKDPIEFSKSSTLKAGVFLNGKPIGKVIARQYDIHKAFGASISLKFPNSKRYDGFGEYNLVNGIRGTINHSDGSWTGFSKNDLIATIDLGSTMSINSIELEALEANASWIFLPKWVRFEVSTDGQDYQLLETINCPSQNTETLKRIYSFTTNIPATDIRYLRITAKNIEVCPPNHPAAGNPAWLFVSEIIVN